MSQKTRAQAAPKRRDEIPPANERAALVQKLRDMGIPPGQVTAMIRSGRSRGQMTDDLIAWLKERPRKQG